MVHEFDVIVVGAGPGGATAAWKLAEGGARVLLLERAPSLPRYKPCGGGIPSSVARHVAGLDPAAFADLSITHLRHSWKGRRPTLAPMLTDSGETARIWMVMRSRFDQHLVERATSAGAQLLCGVKVDAVSRTSDSVTVTAEDGRSWTASHLIGADGAKGVVAPRCGLRLGKRYGIAREIELPFTGGADDNRWHPQLEPGAAYLDYGTVPHGYAWVFPKRGFLSVGSGMLLPEQPDAHESQNIGVTLKKAIDSLLASVQLSIPTGSAAPRLWAHPIPYWTGHEPLTTEDERVMLVGDAAGLVQPMFGEGIQYALRSGDLAARCVLEKNVGGYLEKVRDLFAEEFDAAARVGRAFHKLPYLSYRLGVQNPRGTRLVGRLMAGEASLVQLEKRIYERLKNPLNL
jgi:geranylgeranyl reductase family protein